MGIGSKLAAMAAHQQQFQIPLPNAPVNHDPNKYGASSFSSSSSSLPYSPSHMAPQYGPPGYPTPFPTPYPPVGQSNGYIPNLPPSQLPAAPPYGDQRSLQYQPTITSPAAFQGSNPYPPPQPPTQLGVTAVGSRHSSDGSSLPGSPSSAQPAGQLNLQYQQTIPTPALQVHAPYPPYPGMPPAPPPARYPFAKLPPLLPMNVDRNKQSDAQMYRTPSSPSSPTPRGLLYEPTITDPSAFPAYPQPPYPDYPPQTSAPSPDPQHPQTIAPLETYSTQGPAVSATYMTPTDLQYQPTISTYFLEQPRSPPPAQGLASHSSSSAPGPSNDSITTTYQRLPAAVESRAKISLDDDIPTTIPYSPPSPPPQTSHIPADHPDLSDEMQRAFSLEEKFSYRTHATPVIPKMPPPSFTSPNGHRYKVDILAKLKTAVCDRQLRLMYPESRLSTLADHLATRIDMEIFSQWIQVPVEVVLDLSALTLYEIVLYLDDSSSMFGRTWDVELQGLLRLIVTLTSLLNEDGIHICFMNSAEFRSGIRSEKEIKTLMKEVQPYGLTPIGTALKSRILNPFLDKLRDTKDAPNQLKPLLVLTITDGEPAGEPRETLFKVIEDQRQALLDMGFLGTEVAYQFAQVGCDDKAQLFLDDLDNHPQVGDCIDTTSNFQAEAEQWAKRSDGTLKMTPALYILKLLCGGILSEWDTSDES